MSLNNFNVGDIYKENWKPTVKDIENFSKLSGDYNPIHNDLKFSLNYGYLLKKINVNELKNIQSFEVRKHFNDYKNTSIFLVPINEISDSLIKYKWIKEISILRM